MYVNSWKAKLVWIHFFFWIKASKYVLVPAAEIRDHETGLVSGSFSWFQSRQIFREIHETGKHYIF